MSIISFVVKHRSPNRLRLQWNGRLTADAAKRLEGMSGIDGVDVHEPSHSMVVRFRDWITSEDDILCIVNGAPRVEVEPADAAESAILPHLERRRDILRGALEGLEAERLRTMERIALLRGLELVYASALEAERRIPRDWPALRNGDQPIGGTPYDAHR